MAHVVKTCNTRERHLIIRVLAVIKTWGDALRPESLGVCHWQSTVTGRMLHVGITGLITDKWIFQCLGSASAVEQPTTAIPRTKHDQAQNWPKIITYDHIHQIFITSCTWFRRSVWPGLYSLWASDTILRHGSGSTLAQVMACWLTAPSHYLNQCWLIINGVLWYSQFHKKCLRYQSVNWVGKLHF